MRLLLRKVVFTPKFDGSSIEKYIKWIKSKHPLFRKQNLHLNLRDEMKIWDE
jgi:hypothetical protein